MLTKSLTSLGLGHSIIDPTTYDNQLTKEIKEKLTRCNKNRYFRSAEQRESYKITLQRAKFANSRNRVWHFIFPILHNFQEHM